MKAINKCPNCGASVEYNEEKTVAKCPYCNSSFQMENTNTPKSTATIKDLQIDDSQPTGKRPKVSIFIFWILFMFVPPVAVVYLVMQIIKQKQWDDRNRH